MLRRGRFRAGNRRRASTTHIRAENLKADVAFLASDTLQGRATPSPGLDAAAEYIASQFRKAGLEPVGDDGYFQTATYHMITPNMEGFEISSGAAKVTSGMLQEAVATDLKDAAVVKPHSPPKSISSRWSRCAARSW